MFPRVTFILGGAASGKSSFAESLVKACDKPMTYLATSQVLDPEMQARVARHLTQRGEGWKTIESPLSTADDLRKLEGGTVCLLDCATMWLSNQMMEGNDLTRAQQDLLNAIAACPANLVIVSNEVGHGIVPDNKLARDFREAQGRLNIRLAEVADLAVLVVAGLPVVLKGQLP